MRTVLLSLCFLAVGCPGGLCGDNSLDAGEACDDGNTSNADGCEANCSLPDCNNGIVDPGEVCLLGPVSITTDTAPQEVIAIDLDGDGNLDLVTANAAGESLSVLLGDSTGGFARLPEVELGINTFAVVAEDFNDDGVLDLASSLQDLDQINIFRGIGDGAFAPLETLSAASPGSMVVADVNNDQFPDLVAATFGTGISVFLNDGGTGFSAPRVFSTPSVVSALVATNVVGNSSLDVVVTLFSTDELAVLEGDGTGDFVLQTPQTAGNGSGSLLVNDFDSDGSLDMAVARFLAGEVAFFGGNGGIFLEAQTVPAFGAVALAAGDINNDGALDVAVASDFDLISSHLGVLLGGAEGFEVLPLLPASDGNVRGIALADLNKDGALDAVLTDQSNAQVLVFLSQP
jgi:cysteine-rich repeat protein